MLNYLKNIEIFKSNRATGLHCYVNGGNTPVFSYVILVKKKGKIEIEQQVEIQCEFEKLPEIIPVKYPVYLSIDGKGILHRQIEFDSSKPAIQLAIPNANEDDFVSEQFDGISQKKYISFARKEFVDDILAKLSDLKFSVIGLTISPFSCLGLFEIFPELPVPFIVGNFEFELDRKTSGIIAFSKIELNDQERNYIIGDNEISSAVVMRAMQPRPTARRQHPQRPRTRRPAAARAPSRASPAAAAPKRTIPDRRPTGRTAPHVGVTRSVPA